MMNNNFDQIFKRMAEFEARLDGIDAFLEEQLQLNPDHEFFEENQDQQDNTFEQPPSMPEDTYNSSDSHYGRRTMPHVPQQSNPTKRTVVDTEFSSPEDSPAYKLLKSKFDEQQRMNAYLTNQQKELKEQYSVLKTTVLDAVPRNLDGSFK